MSCKHAGSGEPGSPPVVFLTMELLAGETLAERLRRDGPLPLADTLAIAQQVAGALEAAHRVGVIHRDLKPANVILVREADALRAVVTDFGIAKTTTSSAADGDGPLTGSGEMLGTPEYMAPEQLEGYAVTTATDIYAFGMLLYEMTTGRPPFEADTPLAAAARRLAQPIPSPRLLRPDIDTAWERVILSCLQRNPGDGCKRPPPSSVRSKPRHNCANDPACLACRDDGLPWRRLFSP